MKRAILILFALLFAGITQAQSLTWEPYRNSRSVYGMYTFWKVAGQDTAAPGAYIVNIDGLIADIAALKAKADSVLALATPRVFKADSLVSADTASYDFGNSYLKGYLTIYNSTGGADTVIVEHYSPTKLGWTSLAIGLRDQLTDLLEADNTTIIVATTATKTYEINYLRPGNIRVRWKTNTGKSASNKAYLGFTGIN